MRRMQRAERGEALLPAAHELAHRLSTGLHRRAALDEDAVLGVAPDPDVAVDPRVQSRLESRDLRLDRAPRAVVSVWRERSERLEAHGAVAPGEHRELRELANVLILEGRQVSSALALEGCQADRL